MYNTAAARLARHFGQGVTADEVAIDGRTVIVTTGTGDGIYAYEESEIAAWLAGTPGDYTDFCARMTPTTDVSVAQAVAAADLGWGEGRGHGWGPLCLS